MQLCLSRLYTARFSLWLPNHTIHAFDYDASLSVDGQAIPGPNQHGGLDSSNAWFWAL